jgi:hypothetical protein
MVMVMVSVLVRRKWNQRGLRPENRRSPAKRSLVFFIVCFSVCLGFVKSSCDNPQGAKEIETAQARSDHNLAGISLISGMLARIGQVLRGGVHAVQGLIG